MAQSQIPAPEIGRRNLLGAVTAIVGAPPWCCKTPSLPDGCLSFAPGKVLVNLALVPDLRRRTGAAFSVVDEDRKINLLLIHVERGRYVAMDRTCTHGGAQCTYNPKRQTLQCTSLNHAEYDLQGTLLHGRTHGNLRTYQTGKSGTTIEISLQDPA
jgi:nitrite reductase/ring-hydroxylating ferredoxin subunit